ncbi:Uncharacterized protein APZ42_030489 [Daphnia magna]|uniref:Uncharacterized protein n=1 Tax=Daphnia magna TaxID=35525 RepID=A0A162DD28_9CRUS|nr:Uncharacterized protein APZ42_030489 [Daphnia magna]
MKYDIGQKLNILSQAGIPNWSCESQWNDARKVTENRIIALLPTGGFDPIRGLGGPLDVKGLDTSRH